MWKVLFDEFCNLLEPAKVCLKLVAWPCHYTEQPLPQKIILTCSLHRDLDSLPSFRSFISSAGFRGWGCLDSPPITQVSLLALFCILSGSILPPHWDGVTGIALYTKSPRIYSVLHLHFLFHSPSLSQKFFAFHLPFWPLLSSEQTFSKNHLQWHQDLFRGLI